MRDMSREMNLYEEINTIAPTRHAKVSHSMTLIKASYGTHRSMPWHPSKQVMAHTTAYINAMTHQNMPWHTPRHVIAYTKACQDTY